MRGPYLELSLALTWKLGTSVLETNGNERDTRKLVGNLELVLLLKAKLQPNSNMFHHIILSTFAISCMLKGPETSNDKAMARQIF